MGISFLFRTIQASWSEKLNELSRKYGSAIAKGRPYYEAKLKVDLIKYLAIYGYIRIVK